MAQMKVVCIQPSYLPWKGYFHLIQKADLFVFLDDVQYTQRDWRNRNRIKTPNGLLWLTVPVRCTRRDQKINEIDIDIDQNWQELHRKSIDRNYIKTPYFRKYMPFFDEIYYKRWKKLVELDIFFTKKICILLHITTPTIRSSDLNVIGHKTDKIIQICQKTGANHYISGPAAKAYIKENKFTDAGIKLEYMVYDYLEYPQLWGEFFHKVSIVDMLFNLGNNTGKYIWGSK